ncbi:carboxypeptidase regulatory-like domain-containing protein [Mucilaginibacter sp. CAU 1740]|uniref:TonB-dependent receptor n=1 Tax=Mucilaginibacter sp. CAU 1740 TaxID=3140365 RepID=UPI00325B9C50
MFKLRCFLFLAMLLVPYLLLAQTTKSNLSGIVYDSNKVAIEGAIVRIVYQPASTQYGCSSNKAGRFYLPDLKPGGPYQIEISYTGYEPFIQQNVYLGLDEPEVLNVVLKNKQTQLQEVRVSASPINRPALTTAQTGPSVKNNRQNLNSLPTIKRSVNDFIRLTPQSFGPAIAGGNYRQNFITIDGSEFNNNFGVGDNLPGNGAQPVSLDAIDRLSVNVAPFNAIWESGFIGSTINITTRTGSNHTEASVYRFYRNQNSYGYHAGNASFDKRNLSYHQDGIRIGGPIVANKLFYFFSAEGENEKYNPQQLIPATTDMPYGSGPNTARPTVTELNQIGSYLRDTYRYDPGSYGNYEFENKSYKILGRIDWNIGDNNTFSIRYNQLVSTRPELVNGSRSPLTAFPAGAGRRSINALPFSNSNFSTQSNFYSLAAEWNAKLNSGVYNTFRASYTRQYEPRQSDSKPFPFVDILKDGIPFTSFGYEPFTYGNSRNVTLASVIDYVNWSHNKNNWLAGAQVDYSRTSNTYIPFGTGYYTFASWDDFVSGKSPVDYAITYSTTPGTAQPSYNFKYANLALFAQNTIILGKRSSITAGFRFDIPWFPEGLAENEDIAKLSFANGLHLHTSQLPFVSLLLSPRVGFSTYLGREEKLRLRGGTGVFTGRIPFVWIISQARYSGLQQVTQTWQGKQNTPGPFSPDPQKYIPDISTQQPGLPAITSVLSKEFKMPQTWKSSIALDVRLPAGFTGTAEVLYNKDINAIVFTDANLVMPKHLNIADYPDNRLVYPAANNQRFINPLNAVGMPDAKGNSPFNAVVVSNSSRGYYWSATFQLERKIWGGFSMSAAYIKSMAKNLNDGDGDQTLSALYAKPTVNGINTPELGYAGYVSPNRVVASFIYRKHYLKKFIVSAGLVYQGAVDGRFSYTYAQDFNHDGTNKSLIYVPRNPSEITFVPLAVNQPDKITYTAAQQSDAFFKYIDQDAYLRKRKGQYAERNGATLPWRNQWDFKLTHDFILSDKVVKHTLQLSWDVFNVGNLLNKNWGLKKLVNANSILMPANLPDVKAGGNIKPTFQLATVGGRLITDTFKNDVSLNSTYSMQIGLRYLFN